MRKYTLLAILFFTINCGNSIRVKVDSVCQKDQLRFDKIFSICMSGQRHTTGTDDADDFVSECNRIAHKESIVNCIPDYYFYYWSYIYTDRASADKLCKDAETKKEKKSKPVTITGIERQNSESR